MRGCRVRARARLQRAAPAFRRIQYMQSPQPYALIAFFFICRNRWLSIMYRITVSLCHSPSARNAG